MSSLSQRTLVLLRGTDAGSVGFRRHRETTDEKRAGNCRWLCVIGAETPPT